MNKFIFLIVVFMALLGVSCTSTKIDICETSIEEQENATIINVYEEHSSYKYTDKTSFKDGFVQGFFRSKEPAEKGKVKINRQILKENIVDIELNPDTHYVDSTLTNITEEKTLESTKVSKNEKGRKTGKNVLNAIVMLIDLHNR